MRHLLSNADEAALWRLSFPCLYDHCQRQGIYVIIDGEKLQKVFTDRADADPVAVAVNRVDLAISYLWPIVKDLFLVDFFPHRLAAATDILRAVDFGDSKDVDDPRTKVMIQELVDALNDAEVIMAEQEKKNSKAACDDHDESEHSKKEK